MQVTVWALIYAASPWPLPAWQQCGGPRLLEHEGGNTEHNGSLNNKVTLTTEE